ncbi:alpha/beta hydrolase [Undibacterium parvum]|uniref:Alpha/beta hydrolase n=1 Tax=Undibacterium parvum TaxID=401471 RepID=A0A3S9HJL1_9BURK|nr:alpha/beta hydrolase [Undibacterium parvum]AZP12298.1 alpha/beta hydrolase [Undibacterium parvum]
MSAHIENTQEFTLSSNDGTQLFVRDWPLEGSATPQDGVFIMHGLGEHCGRYAHVARFFNTLGFAVRTYDHRGHGQSGGSRGDVPDTEALLRDARMLLNDFSKKLQAPPLLFGHSMGGVFAARFATAGLAPVRALILSSPALALHMSGLEKVLLKVASLLIPGLGIPNGLKTRYLSHDAAVVAAYENDALVHGKISARLLNAMLQAAEFSLQHTAQLTIPVLLLVAQQDHLVDPKGSAAFAKNLNPARAKAIFYPDFYHEIFNELEATQVFDDLRTWLEQQHFTPLLAKSA